MKNIILLLALLLSLPGTAQQWTYNTLTENLIASNVASIGNKIFFYSGTKLVGTSSLLSDQVEIFDIQTGIRQVSSVPDGAPRETATTAVLSSKIIIAGGYGSLGTTSRVDLYDTLTGVWSTKDLSVARRDMAGAATADKAFFGGGVNTGNSKVVDIYDLASNTWTATQFPNATLPSQRTLLSAAAVGNKILFAGGRTNSYRDLVSVYNTDTDTWLPNTNLSEYKCYLTSVVYKNKAYFIGGQASPDGSPTTNYPSDTIDIYDSVNDSWSTLKIPRIMYRGNGTKRRYNNAVLSGCKIFITPLANVYTGGPIPGNPDTIAIYDLARNVWSYEALPHPRSGVIMVAAQNKVYFAGGANATAPFGGLNHIDIYTLAPKLQLAVASTPVNQFSYDFGDVIINNTLHQNISLSNEGDYELIFAENPDKITLTGDTDDFTIDLSALEATHLLDPAELLNLPISFTPTTLGPRSITLLVNSNDPDMPNYSFTITGNGTIADKLTENQNHKLFSLYPVPCNEKLQLNINTTFLQAAYTIKDLNGKKIKENTILNPVSQINTLDMTTGIYLIEIQIDQKLIRSKVIKI